MLGRALRLVRARRQLPGPAAEGGPDDVVGHRSGERVLRDRERILVSERACRVARLHQSAGALRFAATGEALGELRGSAIVMERVG